MPNNTNINIRHDLMTWPDDLKVIFCLDEELRSQGIDFTNPRHLNRLYKALGYGKVPAKERPLICRIHAANAPGTATVRSFTWWKE